MSGGFPNSSTFSFEYEKIPVAFYRIFRLDVPDFDGGCFYLAGQIIEFLVVVVSATEDGISEINNG